MADTPGFWQHVALHYRINRGYGFAAPCAFRRALRLVWKTHFVRKTSGPKPSRRFDALHWNEWPER